MTVYKPTPVSSASCGTQNTPPTQQQYVRTYYEYVCTHNRMYVHIVPYSVSDSQFIRMIDFSNTYQPYHGTVRTGVFSGVN